MTAKELREALSHDIPDDARVVIDVELSPLYENITSIGELSPTQRELVNGDDEVVIALRGAKSDFMATSPVNENHIRVHEQMTIEEVKAYLDEVRDKVLTPAEHQQFIRDWHNAKSLSFSYADTDIRLSIGDEDWRISFNRSRDDELILHFIEDGDRHSFAITNRVCPDEGGIDGCGICLAFPFEINDYKLIEHSQAIASYALRWMAHSHTLDEWLEEGTF